MIKVYSPISDELVEVTQKWCDDSAKAINDFVYHKELIRQIAELKTTLERELIRKIGEFVRTEIGVK